MEHWVNNVVVIGVPNGRFDQGAYDFNELQKHLSTWCIKDFHKLGFNVYGQGLKLIYGQDGLLHTSLGHISIIRWLLFFLSYMFSPLVYFHPNLATYIVAVKHKKTG